jgi:hypothetical protein
VSKALKLLGAALALYQQEKKAAAAFSLNDDAKKKLSETVKSASDHIGADATVEQLVNEVLRRQPDLRDSGSTGWRRKAAREILAAARSLGIDIPNADQWEQDNPDEGERTREEIVDDHFERQGKERPYKTQSRDEDQVEVIEYIGGAGLSMNRPAMSPARREELVQGLLRASGGGAALSLDAEALTPQERRRRELVNRLSAASGRPLPY